MDTLGWIMKMLIEQDSRITPQFEADHILLGGKVAALAEYEDRIGAAGAYTFYTEEEEDWYCTDCDEFFTEKEFREGGHVYLVDDDDQS